MKLCAVGNHECLANGFSSDYAILPDTVTLASAALSIWYFFYNLESYLYATHQKLRWRIGLFSSEKDIFYYDQKTKRIPPLFSWGGNAFFKKKFSEETNMIGNEWEN